jgi:hypothetical protein
VGQWLKESLLAWVLSSFLLGLTLTLIFPFKSSWERLYAWLPVGAGAALLSAVPTAVAAIALYAPLRSLLLLLPRSVVLCLCGLGVALLVWIAVRAPQVTGNRESFMAMFWLWVGSVSAAFFAVNALLARNAS